MTLYNEMGVHSYRDLPMRFAEFATLYRYETAGELTGLTRVRGADAGRLPHLLHGRADSGGVRRCAQPDPRSAEPYGFTDYQVRLSLPGRRASTCATTRSGARRRPRCARRWIANGVAYDAVEGEAAFYGPKADFMATDVLGREWQLSTIQVDFIQPARLGLTSTSARMGRRTRRWCCTVR